MSSQETEEASNKQRITRMRLWLKAFIPDDVDGSTPVPAGNHAGKSMFRSPGPIDAWFLTDQRRFSDDLTAHSRMHSEIELDLDTFAILHEAHRCDPTIQVDHHTGAEDCCERADTSDMEFSDFQIDRKFNKISMQLHGSTKNACLKVGPVKVSPNLDYEGRIVLHLQSNHRQATVYFEGMIETYPAFEMYITVNEGTPVVLFQLPIEPDATPLSLVGSPQRSVHRIITVTVNGDILAN